MIDLISVLASWIASFTISDWALVAATVLTIAVVGMTVALFRITRRPPKDDDGLDFYRPGDLAQRYREHEGCF